MTDARFEYAGPYRDYDRARSALDDYFATGEIVEGEYPDIESRMVTLHDGRMVRRYFVTLPW